MTERDTQLIEQFGARVDEIFLIHARFLDSESAGTEATRVSPELPIGLNFAFERLAVDTMVIAINVSVAVEKPYRVEVMYGGRFRMLKEYSDDDREDAWRRCAAQLAPVVLYPYIRELVSNLSTRSRAGVCLLPILSFQTIDPSEMVIPPFSPNNDQLSLGNTEPA